jgi:acetoin utilization deacetylase AcuC-like enzyme
VQAVHTPEYIDFLQVAAREWAKLPGAGAEVVPNVHPARYPATYPKGIVGRAGWHQFAAGCPIGPGTWDAALAAAHCAASAADLVLSGAREVYALCRPPGHHAYADMAGGFCFLNNTAIAAQHLRARHARIAVLDVDVHHGNGTQGIFYERDDVLTVSIHADPSLYYPYFWGHAHETGTGKGHGFNLNLPLPLASPDAAWLGAGDRALARIGEFAPSVLVVALGLDASESDPLQGLKVSGAGFRAMAARIARLGLPTILVQEGGYLSDDLGRNLVQFLAGFDEGRH